MYLVRPYNSTLVTTFIWLLTELAPRLVLIRTAAAKTILSAHPLAEEPFLTFHLPTSIANEFPLKLWSPFKTLIAVSGGADSVALVRGMLEILDGKPTTTLAVLHINHGIRSEESQADAQFVRNIAVDHGLEFHLIEFPPANLSLTPDDPSEESMRNRRYQAFKETAKKIGARYLVTGHHRNDQVETVLFRIFRGTGVSGLKGIPKYRVVDDALTIVRPLLKVSRQQIHDYLATIGQDFRVDSSNRSNDYTRNFLRNEILPRLDQRFANVAEAIARLADQASEIDAIVDDAATGLENLIVQQSKTLVTIDRNGLANVPGPFVQRLLVNIWQQQGWPLKSMNAHWWRTLTEACQPSNSTKPDQKFNLPGLVSAEFSASVIRFSCPN